VVFVGRIDVDEVSGDKIESLGLFEVVEKAVQE